MAEARQSQIRWYLFVALGACSAAFAQSATANLRPPQSIHVQSPRSGSLVGQLTDLHSTPLAGISIILRNSTTGAELHATTAKNGAFRFSTLATGEYTLEADEPRLGRGSLERIVISGGSESRLQAALHFNSAPPSAVAAVAPTQIPLLAPLSSTLPSFLRQLPANTSTPQPATASQTPQRAVTQPAIAAQFSPHLPAPETQSPPTQFVLVPPSAFALRLTTGFLPPVAASVATAVGMHGIMLLKSFALPAAVAAQSADPIAPAVATTLTDAQLQALPVSGRRWQQFLLDAPTASGPPNSSQPSFRGAQQAAEVSIDGASTRLAFGAVAGSGSQASGQDAPQQSDMSQSWNGRRGLIVNESAIREVTAVAGNVHAEEMRAAGGSTGIRTQSGTDSLHGQGFLFDRQNNWGAKNPFTQWLRNTGSSAVPNFVASPFTPSDHEIVWGFGAGSRFRLHKLFWFAALDGSHRNDPGVSTVRNPSEFFNLPEPTSPSVTLLSAQLGESQTQAYNDFLGVAASGYAPAGLEQLASLLGPAPRTASSWVGFSRIDWQAAERHHFSFEGTGADWNAPGGGISRASATDGNHSFGSSHASQEWQLARWEAYLTSNLLAVTQGSAGRAISSAQPTAPSAFEQAFLNGNFWGQLPQIVVDSRYGFTIGNSSRFGQGAYPDEHLYHGQEMIDWVHDHLLVKGGIEIDHNSDAAGLLHNQTGTYHFSNVASFISDALAFQKFGYADELDPRNPHNCGTTATKFGSQPCYSYYSQTMGPANWHLSTNDWASYITAQWQPNKLLVLSAGLRWELEQMPPPIAKLANPALPLTQKLPSRGNDWGPRVSLAMGAIQSRWPVFRLGYGIYYGRTPNSTLLTALTQTGSLNGDLSFFMRPSDDCQSCSGGAPPFPYVFAGQPASVVKPGAVEFAPTFHNPEVHQAVASIEQSLPARVELSASAMLSLGRRLPTAADSNFDPATNPGTITYNVEDPTGQGPIKTNQITVPFYASWPSASSPTGTAGRLNTGYQQISQISSRANSTYEAAMIRIVRNGPRGLSLHAYYIYAHAMDWNPNESTIVAGSDPLDPANFRLEYGTSNLDVRHSASVNAIFQAPWKLHNLAGRFANGWMLSGIGHYRSGMPYTMRTSGSLPEEFTQSGASIVGLGPGMNGSGGDNRVYGVGRNTFRYPQTWKVDFRLAKRFDLGEMRQLELLAESFNLFNHQNVTQLETTGYFIEPGSSSGSFPTLCYITFNNSGNAACGGTTTSSASPVAAFGRPLNVNATDFYRERQIQLGLRMRF